MATLETTFAGLKLKNPIIISSSGLTDSAAKNQKLYEAGAAGAGPGPRQRTRCCALYPHGRLRKGSRKLQRQISLPARPQNDLARLEGIHRGRCLPDK